MKDYVLCVRVDETTCKLHPETVLSKCALCKTDVHIMPHNLENIPICIRCLPEVKTAHKGEFEMAIKKIDVERALEEIVKMEDEKWLRKKK